MPPLQASRQRMTPMPRFQSRLCGQHRGIVNLPAIRDVDRLLIEKRA